MQRKILQQRKTNKKMFDKILKNKQGYLSGKIRFLKEINSKEVLMSFVFRVFTDLPGITWESRTKVKQQSDIILKKLDTPKV